MKPSTGSHLPPEDVKDTHSCWLHCLTAAVPDYFTTPRSSERIWMSVNNARQQLVQVPVAPCVPVVWWQPLQPRRGHLCPSTLLQCCAHRRHGHASQSGEQRLKITVSARFSLFLCPSVLLLLPPVNLDYQCRSRLNFATISSD